MSEALKLGSNLVKRMCAAWPAQSNTQLQLVFSANPALKFSKCGVSAER
eukprot:SAG31_NODE_2629_length_5350_cov_2.286612_2_plen_49_part_00